MDTIEIASTVLAAIELLPGEPSDLTEVLLDPTGRESILGAGLGSPPSNGSRVVSSDHLSPLVSYLIAHLDPDRVRQWRDRLGKGVFGGRYRPVVAGAPDYPQRLRNLWDAPPILFQRLANTGSAWRGRPVPSPDDTSSPAIAIVGGRDASPEVLAATARIAGIAAESGIRVVSGLAAGVDTAAHQGALKAGGVTTAVMGTGINHVFPVENAELAEQIATSGVLLSQFTPCAPRTRTTFLRRNNVIAGLSDASLLMQGAQRSGSRHEIEQALRYGRPVFFWKPAMAEVQWADQFVRAGLASFIDSESDVLTTLR